MTPKILEIEENEIKNKKINNYQEEIKSKVLVGEEHAFKSISNKNDENPSDKQMSKLFFKKFLSIYKIKNSKIKTFLLNN